MIAKSNAVPNEIRSRTANSFNFAANLFLSAFSSEWIHGVPHHTTKTLCFFINILYFCLSNLNGKGGWRVNYAYGIKFVQEISRGTVPFNFLWNCCYSIITSKWLHGWMDVQHLMQRWPLNNKVLFSRLDFLCGPWGLRHFFNPKSLRSI